MKNEKAVIKTLKGKNNTQIRNWVLFYLLFFIFSFFSACSSAPAKVTEIYSTRNTAANQLNLANQTASHGRYEDALVILEEARRLAISTDDPSLRIKTLISRGNILFALGRREDAFLDWEDAVSEAEASRQGILASQARIYMIRSSIVMLADENSTSLNSANTNANTIEEYKANLSREMAAVRTDPYSTAAGNVTLGMAEKELGNWAEAENAVRRALAFHERDLNLEETAYDWFLIASIRSMAGNYETALEALESAISFDRRAENGFGLASSWQAMGDVLLKAGRVEESRSAWRRAADIYAAIDFKDLAAKLENQL